MFSHQILDRIFPRPLPQINITSATIQCTILMIRNCINYPVDCNWVELPHYNLYQTRNQIFLHWNRTGNQRARSRSRSRSRNGYGSWVASCLAAETVHLTCYSWVAMRLLGTWIIYFPIVYVLDCAVWISLVAFSVPFQNHLWECPLLSTPTEPHKESSPYQRFSMLCWNSHFLGKHCPRSIYRTCVSLFHIGRLSPGSITKKSTMPISKRTELILIFVLST